MLVALGADVVVIRAPEPRAESSTML